MGEPKHKRGKCLIGIGTKKFKLQKTSAKITSQGGLVLVDKMAEAMGVFSSLEDDLGHLKRRKRGYKVSENVIDPALVRLYVSGDDVISDIKQLEMDEVVKGYPGRNSIMSRSTAVEFLLQFTSYEISLLSRTACGVDQACPTMDTET